MGTPGSCNMICGHTLALRPRKSFSMPRAFGGIQLALGLLLAPQLLNAAGPPASGSFSPNCPGTAWDKVLNSSPWGGVLPGDAVNDDFPRLDMSKTARPGYPPKPPPACFHGAANYVGWVATNGFARAFMIMYDVFTLIGEAKHGLWQWTQEHQDPEVEFWWSQLGGNAISTKYMSGHGDPSMAGGHMHRPPNDTYFYSTVHGMQDLWEHIRSTPNVNKFGPLAVKAKLPALATTAVRMNHGKGVHTWGNNGDGHRPYFFPVDTLDTAEVYVFEASYSWPDMFHGNEPCPINESESHEKCDLHNTFIGLVVEKRVSGGYKGLAQSGLHYGPDAAKCPEKCGFGPCRCSAILFDLVLHGFLSDLYTDALKFLPAWVNPWLGPTGSLPAVGDDDDDDDDVSLSKGITGSLRNQTSEIRNQKSEISNQQSAISNQQSEIRNQKAEIKAEIRNQKSEIRKQKSEIRKQKAEIRNQKSEIRNQKSIACHEQMAPVTEDDAVFAPSSAMFSEHTQNAYATVLASAKDMSPPVRATMPNSVRLHLGITQKDHELAMQALQRSENSKSSDPSSLSSWMVPLAGVGFVIRRTRTVTSADEKLGFSKMPNFASYSE